MVQEIDPEDFPGFARLTGQDGAWARPSRAFREVAHTTYEPLQARLVGLAGRLRRASQAPIRR